MSRVDEMRSLTEHLARSHADRAAAVATQRAAVASDLAGFLHAHSEMASHQREALFTTTAGRRAAIRRTAREVRAARRASADLLAAKLGRNRLDRARQTRHLMNRFVRSRRMMATTQRATRRAGRAALKNDTAHFLGTAVAHRTAFAKVQRAALETSRTELQAQIATLLRGFHATRRALAADLSTFSGVWRQFAGAMRTSSAGGAPPPRPPQAGLPSFLVARFAEERQGEQPQRVELAGVAAAGAPFVEPPGMPLQEEVFRHLAGHPEGLGIAELQSHFGASRIQMAQALNRLIEHNKARRDEDRRLYFAG